MAWNIEVTDTFAGEANYCWVRRYTVKSFPSDTQQSVMRRAKAVAGFTGVRGRTDWHGDSARFDVRGACIVMFVQWVEPEQAYEPDKLT